MASYRKTAAALPTFKESTVAGIGIATASSHAASIEGESTILNASPIQRAHPKFVENLNALGADVSWVAGD